MKRIIFYAIISMMLVSCATRQYVKFTGESDAPVDKARIYVIRSSIIGSGSKVAVFCNDKLIGNIFKGYFAWDVDEGEYVIGNTQFVHAGVTLGSAIGEDLVRLNAKKGKKYYIQIKSNLKFNILTSEKGEKLVKGRRKPKVNYIE
ncbi:hypothetical protein ACI76Q_09690 [Capnocytophaga canimorsus]|uniref:hypothetical protein n=1 Tax=Capnocytophaga canimorsus TaxID=28188 RepID=UPI0037D31B01